MPTQLGEALAARDPRWPRRHRRPIGATCWAVPAAAACAPPTRRWPGSCRRTRTSRRLVVVMMDEYVVETADGLASHRPDGALQLRRLRGARDRRTPQCGRAAWPGHPARACLGSRPGRSRRLRPAHRGRRRRGPLPGRERGRGRPRGLRGVRPATSPAATSLHPTWPSRRAGTTWPRSRTSPRWTTCPAWACRSAWAPSSTPLASGGHGPRGRRQARQRRSHPGRDGLRPVLAGDLHPPLSGAAHPARCGCSRLDAAQPRGLTRRASLTG